MRKCILNRGCVYQGEDVDTHQKICYNGCAEYPCTSKDVRVRNNWKSANFAYAFGGKAPNLLEKNNG